jgi:ribosomal protein L44E
MARKRAIAPMKKTPQQSKQVASAGETPTPRHSSRPTRGTTTQRPVYTEPELSDDEDHQPAPTKGKAGTYMYHQPEEEIPLGGPPAPRYNTRHKQAQLSEPSQDATSEGDDVEEIPCGDDYPLYKDDLPNAFNGPVDPTLNFISKAPNEVIDNILSHLILDHDPDRGVAMKAGTYKPLPHVLLSLAAMSPLLYHATEGFARRYLTKHELGPFKPATDWSHHPEVMAHLEIAEETERNKRRSSRIANIPKPETHEFYRKRLWDELRSHCAMCHQQCWRPGKLANKVSVCERCEHITFGSIMVCRLSCAVKLATNYNPLEPYRCPEAIRPPRLYVDQVTQARTPSQVPGSAHDFLRLRVQANGLPCFQASLHILFPPQRS